MKIKKEAVEFVNIKMSKQDYDELIRFIQSCTDNECQLSPYGKQHASEVRSILEDAKRKYAKDNYVPAMVRAGQI